MTGYNPFNERKAGKVPASIASRHDVSDRAVRVYSVLTMFAGKNGECFPGEEKIAAFAGKSVRRTRDAMAELVAKNLITYERVKGRKTRGIKFITPDSSVLSTPDDIDRSTPDTFDHLTGQFCPISPDTFDRVHNKELKHSLKHSNKTARARDAEIGLREISGKEMAAL